MGVKYMQTWEELAYARQEGREEGRMEGRQEGRMEELVKLICKKTAKNKTIEKIADELEEEIGYIQPIYEIAIKFAPEYDYKKVYEEYCKYDSQSAEKLETIWSYAESLLFKSIILPASGKLKKCNDNKEHSSLFCHNILKPYAASHHKISDDHLNQFRELHKEEDRGDGKRSIVCQRIGKGYHEHPGENAVK